MSAYRNQIVEVQSYKTAGLKEVFYDFYIAVKPSAQQLFAHLISAWFTAPLFMGLTVFTAGATVVTLKSAAGWGAAIFFLMKAASDIIRQLNAR